MGLMRSLFFSKPKQEVEEVKVEETPVKKYRMTVTRNGKNLFTCGGLILDISQIKLKGSFTINHTDGVTILGADLLSNSIVSFYEEIEE